MKLAIVIVNYKSAGMVIDCLQTLEPEVVGTDTQVLVTDNASPDDSLAVLGAAIESEGWGSWARLMPLPENGGFAYGNNMGIREALGDSDPPEFVLLLNPDTLVRPGAIAPLLAFLEAHPEVGLVGSRLEDPDGTPQCSAFRFPTVLGEMETATQLGVVTGLVPGWLIRTPITDLPKQTDWVAGASLMVRRSVFEQVGLLDEGYFLYYEEVDFCLRARRAGWPCWYVPESRVVHLVGQTSGVTSADRMQRPRPRFWFESQRRYYLFNHGPIRVVLLDLARTLGLTLNRFVELITRRPPRQPKAMLQDTIRYGFLLWGHKHPPRQIQI